MESELFSVKHIPSEMAINFLFYVQMAGHFKCSESYVAKRKKYDSILVGYTMSGVGHLKYRNRNYEMKEGIGFIIDCNEPHVYFSDRSNLWEFIWVHFKGSQSFQMVQFILNNNGPLFNAEINGKVQKSMQNIIDTLNHRGVYSDILISGSLNDILIDILLKNLSNGAEKRFLPDIINKLINFIEYNYAGNINLDNLAKRLFTNKYDMIRKFKKYIGVTPYEYLIKWRINNSKGLLENSDLSIAEIAEKVGFNTASYFIKVFKEHEKTTPLSYRKSWTKNISGSD
jgi:AraC-like DNA-binding protein